MAMIYMTSEKHGAMHVYSEQEAVANEANGWVRAEWPPKPKEPPKVEPVAVQEPEQRKTISLKK